MSFVPFAAVADVPPGRCKGARICPVKVEAGTIFVDPVHGSEQSRS